MLDGDKEKMEKIGKKLVMYWMYAGGKEAHSDQNLTKKVIFKEKI